MVPTIIVLDLDDTLYDYDAAHHVAMDAVQRKTAQLLNIDKKTFFDYFAKARDEVKKQLGPTAASHSRLLYFQRFLECLSHKTQVAMTLNLEQTYWRAFLIQAVLFDGVKDFLFDAKSMGIKLAVLTDLTAEIQFRKLIHFGLEEYIDFVVTSEEALYDKPHAKPFEILKHKLELTGKEAIWFVGDHPVADVQGAKEHLGAIVFQRKKSGTDCAKQVCKPDVSFSHFSELRERLASFKNNVS